MIGDKQKAWEALEKAIRLVGAASETADMPDALRGELMTALAALVWVSHSIRCPTCGRWYPSYLQRRDRAKDLPLQPRSRRVHSTSCVAPAPANGIPPGPTSEIECDA